MIAKKFSNALPLRCRVDDRVMFINGRADLLGRIGIIRCTGKDASAFAKSSEAAEVMARDWVVVLEGTPSICHRGGRTFETYHIAINDPHLMPLHQDVIEIESEQEAAA